MGTLLIARRSSTKSRDSIRDVLDSLRRIVQVLRVTARRAHAQAGISGAQLFVLKQLASLGQATVNELADATRTHQSSVSEVVAHLVRGRLARRTEDPRDRRRTLVDLTTRGVQTARRAPEATQVQMIEALRRFPAKDRDQLALLLKRLSRGLGADEGTPPMFLEDAK